MSNVKRRVKNFSKHLLRQGFEQGQRFGFDVLPRHFYSEIPAIHELKNTNSWKAPYSMAAINGIDIPSQFEFVQECCSPKIVEELELGHIHKDAINANGEVGFGPTEADFLFAFVATKKPQQIFQIGCGVSTAVCLLAAKYVGYVPEIICLEPYPTKYLLEQEQQGNLTLIRQKAQLYSPRNIDRLSEDILFFVDSTHTLGPAGEVSRIVLEMLPRLKKGAWVHFHDIKFPYDYDRHVLQSSLFFQHESILLQAFLCCNDRFSVRASLSMLHYNVPERLVEYLPNYHPAENEEGLNKSNGHFPSSTIIEVVG